LIKALCNNFCFGPAINAGQI